MLWDSVDLAAVKWSYLSVRQANSSGAFRSFSSFPCACGSAKLVNGLRNILFSVVYDEEAGLYSVSVLTKYEQVGDKLGDFFLGLR